MRLENILFCVFQVLFMADVALLVHGLVKKRWWEVVVALIPPVAVVLLFAGLFIAMIRAGF